MKTRRLSRTLSALLFITPGCNEQALAPHPTWLPGLVEAAARR
jgi:hypothetical protein